MKGFAVAVFLLKIRIRFARILQIVLHQIPANKKAVPQVGQLSYLVKMRKKLLGLPGRPR